MSRFLIYTPLASGHVFPLVPGLTELRSRGHEVVVVTDPSLVDVVKDQGLEARPADSRLVQERRAQIAASEPDTASAQLARGAVERDDLAAAITEVTPDVVMVDFNNYGGHLAAELSGLPRGMHLPSLLPYPGRGIPPYGAGMAPRHDLLGRARDAVLWPVVERVFGRRLLPGLNDLRTASGLAPYASPYEHVLGAHRLLVLTGSPLEYARDMVPDRVRFVGFQPWDPPSEPPAWLDEPGDPWVLVTCSTHYLGDEVLATTAAQALADLPVRVVLTLADAYDHVQIPASPRLRVERFVPHAAVLDRAAAVVCPSGMGIVAKAVAKAVPVVAVPFERDQPEVARRVQHAGVGVVLPRKRLTAQRLREVVLAAMSLDLAEGTIDAAANARAYADAAEELLTIGRPVTPYPPNVSRSGAAGQ